LLGKPVLFATDCVGPDAKAKAAALKPGEVLVLENLRFHPEEEGGDEAFSKTLSELGDVYVNDAFGTAHRAHASTTIVAKFFPTAKLFGYLMQAEIDSVGKVLGNPAASHDRHRRWQQGEQQDRGAGEPAGFLR
jgi:phosphoglycerate kinase